eukprot:CAMPEP_0198680428 /NCGR_PEP_ID=MMETSP1468-20131203/4808_1 /TAXON_ID=1461545 /ORGANISM="Mantoniella sp, Strain CCMP1436" /LENGTH=45 /DNA_ID= /DNA_START= /DNA_END= /DNA_ORIENTATION=
MAEFGELACEGVGACTLLRRALSVKDQDLRAQGSRFRIQGLGFGV